MLDGVLRVVSWLAWVVMAGGILLLMAPGVVRRLRHDPAPELPQLPVLRLVSENAADRAAVFVRAVKSVVPDVTIGELELGAGYWLTSSRVGSEGVSIGWDVGDEADTSVLYVAFEAFSDGPIELHPDTDERLAFWLVIGYLRDGPRQGQEKHWVHVREVGMWHPFSGTRHVSQFDPEWVATPPE